MAFTSRRQSEDPHLSSDDLEAPSLSDSIIFGAPIYGTDVAQSDGSFESINSSINDSRIRLAASVFANAHDGILIANAERTILDVNRAYSRITGFQADEIIGERLLIDGSDTHPPSFFESLWDDLDTSGFWRGEINSTHRNGHTRTDLVSLSAVRDARGLLTHYVAIFSDITTLKEIQKKYEHLAYHDALTGLPNRSLLYDRIQQGLARLERQGGHVAICFIDLDNFKPVNDTLGHQIGDQLLIEVSRRLAVSLRGGDSVARLGGDEFALVLCDLKDTKEVREILSRLLTRLSQPYRISNNTISLSASIGYTVAPADSGDPDTLLRHADQAMYVSKQSGRNQYSLFDTAHDRRLRSRNETLTQLYRALENDELHLYYQPKVDIRQGKVVGFEGLIRWAHPKRGLLGPADFLLSLGNHPALVDIGDWAIRKALKQIEAWRAQGICLPTSINIAACHLLHPEFVNRLTTYRAEYPGIEDGQLELEILETTALEDIEHVASIIRECRSLGVDFALDDFGTGYSSLLYLKRLPAKTLKIDQSFTRDMLQTSEGANAIAGIVGLAKAFHRDVIAEGVETIEQGIVLLRLNCDVVQGYAIARPMPADNIPEWTNSYRPDPAWRESIETPWRRSDFPLLAADIEQRRWLTVAKLAAENRDHKLLSKHFRDDAKTPFRHWMENIAFTRYANLPEMEKLPALLAHTKDARRELIENLSSANTSGTEKLLNKHKQKSLALIAGLRNLRLAIAKLQSESPLPAEND